MTYTNQAANDPYGPFGVDGPITRENYPPMGVPDDAIKHGDIDPLQTIYRAFQRDFEAMVMARENAELAHMQHYPDAVIYGRHAPMFGRSPYVKDVTTAGGEYVGRHRIDRVRDIMTRSVGIRGWHRHWDGVPLWLGDDGRDIIGGAE